MLLDYLNFLRKTILETWEAVRVYLKKNFIVQEKVTLNMDLKFKQN